MPKRPYELSVTFPAHLRNEGDEMLDQILGEENAGDCGQGFGDRDRHFNYETEEQAREAAAKLSAFTIPHTWGIEWWDWEAEEQHPDDEEKWHRWITDSEEA